MSISKQKKAAKELIHAAHKVYHYRRDVTSEADLETLNEQVGNLDALIKNKECTSETLDTAMDRLDALLRKIGGKIYPKTFWNDNIEVALVASIIVIGIRTFFFQPFIIPTNSMYPTYAGMNASVYETGEEGPSGLMKAARLVTLGARHREVIAEASGEVNLVLVPDPNGNPTIKRRVKTFGPLTQDQYLFTIGGVPHTLNVPKEFDLRSLLREEFGMSESDIVLEPQSRFGRGIRVTNFIEKGDPFLRFDVLLGDALFVDRISYHFKSPKPGDPFVFRTGEIPGIEGGPNTVVDKYYIKRIGGAEGETLEITPEGTLLVDGKPRDEVEAFGRNERKDEDYHGYVYPAVNDPANPPKLLTGPGVENTVPEGKFVALGDNSANSLDSRYWGYVPEKSVIGKAIFIYYPFTKRWGVAE